MVSEPIVRTRRPENLDLGVQHAGFSYQLQAVEAVKDLPYAALFHEQGLGKTKIGIDLALEWLRTDAVDAVRKQAAALCAWISAPNTMSW